MERILLSDTFEHAIEVYEDCLTIGTKRFPDDCVSLGPEETEEVLKSLLAWKSGSPGSDQRSLRRKFMETAIFCIVALLIGMGVEWVRERKYRRELKDYQHYYLGQNRRRLRRWRR